MRSGRVLSRQWSDRKPFTRRVRWYCEVLTPEGRGRNIRLVFEDTEGSANKLYGDDKEAAEKHYEAFKAGRLTTAQLRKITPSLFPKNIDKIVQREINKADGVPSTVPCASCGKPARTEAAMHREGRYWHQRCPPPKGEKT